MAVQRPQFNVQMMSPAQLLAPEPEGGGFGDMDFASILRIATMMNGGGAGELSAFDQFMQDLPVPRRDERFLPDQTGAIEDTVGAVIRSIG